MLGVLRDQIVTLYYTHKSRYGSPNTCNWKGYKIPFRRPGHIFTYICVYLCCDVAFHAYKLSSACQLGVTQSNSNSYCTALHTVAI